MERLEVKGMDILPPLLYGVSILTTLLDYILCVPRIVTIVYQHKLFIIGIDTKLSVYETSYLGDIVDRYKSYYDTLFDRVLNHRILLVTNKSI